MGLDRAIADMKRITQGEFSREIILTTPDGSQSAIVRGLVSKHNLSIDPDTGVPVNSRNVHISVVESVLIDAGYPTRDSNDEITLIGHKAEWVDASGNSYPFNINENMPSETTGLIVCTLGDLNG